MVKDMSTDQLVEFSDRMIDYLHVQFPELRLERTVHHLYRMTHIHLHSASPHNIRLTLSAMFMNASRVRVDFPVREVYEDGTIGLFTACRYMWVETDQKLNVELDQFRFTVEQMIDDRMTEALDASTAEEFVLLHNMLTDAKLFNPLREETLNPGQPYIDLTYPATRLIPVMDRVLRPIGNLLKQGAPPEWVETYWRQAG